MSPLPDRQICRDVQHDLEAYLEGALDTERVQRVERHLSDCPDCLAQLHLAKEIQNELRALPEIDAPALVIQSIHDQTVRSAKPTAFLTGRLTGWQWPVWATLAAACLALVIGFAVLNQTATPPSRPDADAIAQAAAEARFALARVGLATHKAGLAVRDTALHEHVVIPTHAGLSEALNRTPSQETGSLYEGVDDV